MSLTPGADESSALTGVPRQTANVRQRGTSHTICTRLDRSKQQQQQQQQHSSDIAA